MAYQHSESVADDYLNVALGNRYSGAWASWLNVAAGVWEVMAPWIWGYAVISPAAMWNAVILGIAVILIGILAATTPYIWPSLWNAAFGIWLIVAPFALHYNVFASRARGNDIVVGIVVAALAITAGAWKVAWRIRYGREL